MKTGVYISYLERAHNSFVHRYVCISFEKLFDYTIKLTPKLVRHAEVLELLRHDPSDSTDCIVTYFCIYKYSICYAAAS